MEVFPPEILSGVGVTSFSKNYSRHNDAVSAYAHCRSFIPSPLASASSVPATFLDYFDDIVGFADCDFVDMNARNEPLQQTVLQPAFNELQETCIRADVDVFFSLMDEDDLAHGVFKALVAGDVLYNDPYWRSAEVWT